MMRSASLLIVGTLILMLAAPPVAAFPEVEEDIYSWHVDSPADNASDRCMFTGPTPLEAPAPCDILGYSIGNTDTHVYFRWTLGTLAFGPLGAEATVLLRQVFSGTHEENGLFRFCMALDSSGISAYHHASCFTTAGWENIIESKLTPGTPGFVEFAVPLGAIEPHVNGTLQAGAKTFTVSGPGTRVSNFGLPENVESAAWPTFYPSADALVVPDSLFHYVLQPYGSLTLPPEEPDRIVENITGIPVTISASFDTPTTELRAYNWPVEVSAFILNQTVDLQEGNITLVVLGPDGESRLDAILAAGTADELFSDVDPGNWTIEITLDGFVGSFEITLHEPAGTGDGSDGTENGDGDGANGNETADDDPELDESGGIPAPGMIVLVLATMGLLTLLRRK